MENRGLLLSKQTLGRAAGLFVLNALICRELFVTEYTTYRGSIEAAYFAISRYAIEHPFDWSWFPLWYGGIPYHNTYPPLLHLIVAAVAWALGISTALSHHAVSAVFYSLGPVAVYLLALEFSRKQGPSLIAGLAVSLFSPAQPLLSQIQSFVPSPRSPTRLYTLVQFGDGPHLASVALFPLALLALHFALERRTPLRVYLAAVALAAVVLTNWLGAFSLAIAAASYLLARSGQRGWLGRLLWAALVGALAFGLAVPWIPPSAIRDIAHNAQSIEGRYPMTPAHFVYAACVCLAAILLWRLLRRPECSFMLAFSAYLTLFFAALTLSNDWLGVQLMPQPHRYHHELEMAVCLLVAFALGPLAERRRLKRYSAVLAVLAVGIVALQYRRCRQEARALIQPLDMTQTVEYEASTWLGEHFPHDRIFTVGATRFWLNVFADTPQLAGGFDQGIVNRQLPAVLYGIPFMKANGPATALWLRLYGNHAVFVSGPGGRDYFKGDWRDPAKLQGVLPEIWRDGGDVIYGVPQRTRSLAHVILPEHVPYRFPETANDIQPLEALAHALEDPALPLASFEWTAPSAIRIESDLEPDQLLFLQVAYHPGWRALVGGEQRRIRKDALGLMIVEPRCAGPCEVTMIFDGGVEMLLARLLCGVTILGGLVWLAASIPARGPLPRSPARP